MAEHLDRGQTALRLTHLMLRLKSYKKKRSEKMREVVIVVMDSRRAQFCRRQDMP